MTTVIVPLVICLLVFLAFTLIGVYLYRAIEKYQDNKLIGKKNQIINTKDRVLQSRKNFSQFIFFSLWGILGLSMLLQIIPLDMTVADRWFYFPMIGVLGLVGIAFRILQKVSYRYGKFIWLIVFSLIVILSFRTYLRTLDWKNEITLFTQDLSKEKDNYFIMINLAKDFNAIGNQREAIYYQEKVLDIYVDIASLNEMGTMYQEVKAYDKAIATFSHAVHLSEDKSYTGKDKNQMAPYANLAYTFLLKQQPDNAIDFLSSKALKKFPYNSDLYLLLAIAQSQIHHQGLAVQAAKRAYQLSQNENTQQIYYRVTHNIPITTE